MFFYRFGRLFWVPDDELNREEDWSMEWMEEAYGEKDREAIFERRKRFITDSDEAIRTFLKRIRVRILDGYV